MSLKFDSIEAFRESAHNHGAHDIPAGSTLEIDGSIFIATIGEDCSRCAFFSDSEAAQALCSRVRCNSETREDSESVVFMTQQEFLMARIRGEA